MLNEAVGYKVLAQLSNLSYLAALGVALRFRNYLVAWPIGATFLVSLYYHVCSSFDTCGGLQWATTRLMDHLTAPFTLFAIAVLIVMPRDDDVTDADIDRRLSAAAAAAAHERERELDTLDAGALTNGPGASLPASRALYQQVSFWGVLVLTATALAGIALPFSVYVSWATIAAVLIALILYYAVIRVERDNSVGSTGWVLVPFALHGLWLILGFLIGAGALICYFYTPPGGGVVAANTLSHSLWHILGGLALVCFILARELRPPVQPKVIDLAQPRFKRHQSEGAQSHHQLPRQRHGTILIGA